MTETLCDSGAVKLKAGNYASTLTAVEYTDLINEAEAEISGITRKDWVAVYASVSPNFKGILRATASDLTAMKVIIKNPSGFPSRTAETALDYLRDSATRNLNILKDAKIQEVFV
jgi:hypothetical protein